MTTEEIVARFKDEHPEFDSLHEQIQEMENQIQETLNKCEHFMSNISTVEVYEILSQIRKIELEVYYRENSKYLLSSL